jgi:hypothetical protein
LSESAPYSAANPLFWAEVYPKGTWYFAASVYELTGNIEAGKAYTLLVMAITFCVYYDCLRMKFGSTLRPIIVSLFAAANPIAVAQFQSYYVDGLVSCAILSVFLLFATMMNREYSGDRGLILLCAVCLILIGCNVKFSSALFLGSVTVCFFVIYMIYFMRGRVDFIKPSKLFLLFAGSAIVAIPVVGWSPYITNTLRYKSPLYGLIGGDVALLGSDNLEMSGAIRGLNNTQMFFASLFGKMSHGEHRTVGDLLKVPFTVSWDELGFYNFVDTRLGGMGVLFGGIFLLSCVILLVCGITGGRKRALAPHNVCLFALVSVTIAEMLILPASYQARYIGFICIVPVMALAVVFCRNAPSDRHGGLRADGSSDHSVARSDRSGERPGCATGTSGCAGGRFKMAAAVFLSAAMFLNCMPWGYPALQRIIESAHTRTALKSMATSGTDQPFEVLFYLRDFSGLNYNLRDFGVPYVIAEEERPGDDFQSTYFNWIFYRQAVDLGQLE